MTITDSGLAVAANAADAACSALRQDRSATLSVIDSFDSLGVARSMSPDEPPPSPLETLVMIGDMGTALVDALGAVDPHDPTPTKTTVVLCLAGWPEQVRPRELVEPTRLSSGGVSQLLDRLEAAAMVRRRSGATADRRSVVIELTDDGERLLQRHLVAVGAQLADIRPKIDDFAAFAVSP